MRLLQRDKIPSFLTMAWGAFIIVSASFMRQLYTFASSVTSKETITLGVWLGIISLGFLVLYSIRSCRKNSFFVVIPVSAAFLFAYSMEITEERTHIIKYGLLGFLLFRDFRLLGAPTSYFLSLLWGLSAGIIDETFQWILPYRVGDVRDVFFDTISVFLGALICHSLAHQSLSAR